MDISVSTSLHNVPTGWFMAPQLLSNVNVEQNSILYTEITNNDEPILLEHWNGSHLNKDHEKKPRFWSAFHEQEMIRCLLEKFQSEGEAAPLSSKLYQRAEILRTILFEKWTKGEDERKRPKPMELRKTLLVMLGVHRTENSQRWSWDSGEKYASFSDSDEWVLVLDARSTRQLLDDIGDNGAVKVYSTGLRIVRKTNVKAEHINTVEEAIDSGLQPFNPAKFLKLCVQMSVDMGEDRPSGFRAYRPQINVEGEWMFSHSLHGKFGGEPTNRDGSIVCDGSYPLVLKYGDNGTVELMLHFAEDEEGIKRFSNLGFRVETNGRMRYRSLHPTRLGLSFEPELSRTRANEVNHMWLRALYRDLTKAFRIIAKQTRNPGASFTKLGGLGIPRRHMKWRTLVYKTEFYQSIENTLLRINGWI
jgi:hypothetical protein